MTSLWSVTRRRLPWLVMLLFIGMFTATILQNFERTIEQVDGTDVLYADDCRDDGQYRNPVS